MTWLRRVWMLFHWRRFRRDLEEEMRLHLDLRAAAEREKGLPPDEAGREARRRFGNPGSVGDDSRDAWGWGWLEGLAQDARYALRTLRKSPGFTAVAVLALALGIGANTAIFSVVNAVLLRPLPYADDERLAVILHNGDAPVAPANFLDWRAQARSFDRMGAAEAWSGNVTGVDVPLRVSGLRVTADIFPLLGVAPLLGRTFHAEEDQTGNDHVVILSHGFWQARFAGDPQVVGKTIRLNGTSFTVVGVMPNGFRFAPFWIIDAELWTPLALGERATSRVGNSLRVFAHLRPGASLAEARAEMATLTARLESEFPGTNRDVTVQPLRDKVVGSVRPALLVLVAAVAFVLLIACANIAHMLLARGAARQREVALRAALGASRGRVVRQLLTESVILAVLGGAVGLAIAAWGVQALVAVHPGDLPRVDTVSVDVRVLLFMLAVSLVAGVAFGLLPALQASALDLTHALKDGGRGSTEGGGRGRLRSLLMVSQVALTLVLLVGAGLMIRTFAALQSVDRGFDPRGVLSMQVSVTGAPEEAPERRALFFRQLVERAGAVPGVDSAAAINHLPLAGDVWGLPFWIEGRPVPPPAETETATYRVVLPGYFQTMRLPILRGRDVAHSDAVGAPGVVLVNEHLARTHWPGGDALGKRINVSDPAQGDAWLTVVGVVKDAAGGEWAAPPRNEVYLPYLQERQYLEAEGPWRTYLTLVARSSGDPAALAPALRAEVKALAPSATVSSVQTMEEVVADANGRPRLYLVLLGAFAATALALAVVGIYGVMSHSVSRRTQEIGVRMALGARRGEVLRLVVGQSMRLALIGIVVGLAGALGLTRLMAGLLYGVAPVDALTFGAVALGLCVIAAGATYLPARRATRVDPMSALRSD